MKLYGLLLTFSLVLADDYGAGICKEMGDQIHSGYDYDDENHVNSDIPEIQCLLHNFNLLNCTWSTHSFPQDAQYSASFQFWESFTENPLNCTSDDSKKMVECLAHVKMEHEKFTEEIITKVNISRNNLTICKEFSLHEIEKLNPPQITATLVKSTSLEIQWTQPGSCCTIKHSCFIYELMINNNKSVTLTGQLAYNITNFDPTRSYTIQIKAKQGITCANTEHWSDWSTAIKVTAFKSTYELNAAVVASIAFVLPMILLAFLLVCKFQRLFDKVLPSIPNPSKNVQMLLEKNDFNPVVPQKQGEEETVILEVIG